MCDRYIFAVKQYGGFYRRKEMFLVQQTNKTVCQKYSINLSFDASLNILKIMPEC